MWWRELCESGNRLDDWDEFKRDLRRQFRMDNLTRRARDDLYALRQREKEPVSDFLHKFRQVCIRIDDLSEAEKLDKFLRALNTNVRMQVELKEPATFEEAARYADRADNVLTRVSGQGSSGRSSWFKGNSSHGGANAAGVRNFQPRTSGGPEPMEIGTSYVQRKPLTPEEKKYLRENQRMLLLPQGQRRTLEQGLSYEEEQVWRKAGKLRRSLNIRDNDRTTPDSMKGTDDKDGQVMMVEKTEIPTSAILEDAGPAEVSEPVIEYGFISRLIEEAGSDQEKSMLHTENLQEDAVPRMETVHETAVAAHRVGVSDQGINNSGGCVESGEEKIHSVDTHSIRKSC